MDRFRIPPAFALVAVAACASRPTPPPTPVESQAPNPAPVAAAPEPVPALEPASAPTPSSSPAAAGPDDPTTPVSAASETELVPGVASGAVIVRGELHPTRVEAAVRTAYPAIRECHRKALERGTVEDKPVRVHLNFEITDRGLITKLTDDTANLNPLFSSCVLLAVSTVTFQPPKRGVVSVTYPLELTKP
jgi:hypothetical protein